MPRAQAYLSLLFAAAACTEPLPQTANTTDASLDTSADGPDAPREAALADALTSDGAPPDVPVTDASLDALPRDGGSDVDVGAEAGPDGAASDGGDASVPDAGPLPTRLRLHYTRMSDGLELAATTAQRLASGDYVVAGHDGTRRPLAMRVGARGAVQWVRAFGDGAGDVIRTSLLLPTGDVLLMGSRRTGASSTVGLAVQFGSDGAVRWAKTYAGTSELVAAAWHQDGFAVAGGPASGHSAVLALDGDGAVRRATSVGQAGGARDATVVTALAPGPGHDLWVGLSRSDISATPFLRLTDGWTLRAGYDFRANLGHNVLQITPRSAGLTVNTDCYLGSTGTGVCQHDFLIAADGAARLTRIRHLPFYGTVMAEDPATGAVVYAGDQAGLGARASQLYREAGATGSTFYTSIRDALLDNRFIAGFPEVGMTTAFTASGLWLIRFDATGSPGCESAAVSTRVTDETLSAALSAEAFFADPLGVTATSLTLAIEPLAVRVAEACPP
jgi:hypothetical protein